MRILLRDFNVKTGREDTLKLTSGMGVYMKLVMTMGLEHKICNIKKSIIKNTIFSHHSIHTNTWTSHDRKTQKT
jgi:hypothetical protein